MPAAAPTYTYDAENRLITYFGTTGAYTYDGNNLRVKKAAGGTTTVHIFSGAKVIAEYDNGAAPASPSREYIYSGSSLLAKIESGTSIYYHPDILSNRVLTDSSGNIIGQSGHYPFGDSWYETGATTKLKFTTYERDSESTNDYAMMRSYVSRFGRFSSPDRLPGTLSSPQSLNRYAYTLNDPINLGDPTGLFISAVPSPPPAGTLPWLFSGNICDFDSEDFTTSIFDCSSSDGPYGFSRVGGGGGGDPVKLLNALANCTSSIYGVQTLGFTASQPGSNGSFEGSELFPNEVGQLPLSIRVTNDVSLTMQQIVDSGATKGDMHSVGYTSIQNPSVTYTASDAFTFPAANAGPLGVAMDTQLTELGNALQLITHPESLPQVQQRDNQIISDVIGEPTDSRII